MTTTRPLADSVALLLSQLGTHSARRIRERMQPLGLHPRQFGMLVHLAAAEGRSQQEVSDALGIHRSAMVALVDELSGRGLIERRPRPGDRRANALHLTPAGREVLARAGEVAAEHEADLLLPLDGGERAHLLALLRRVAAAQGLTAGVHPGLQEDAGPHGKC
jgi:DNA-binding MarR family transcriptional regulator